MQISKLRISVMLALMPFSVSPALAGGAYPDDYPQPEAVIVVPVEPGMSAQPMEDALQEPAVPRAPRPIPEIRDPSRGMYDPYTEREGDSRTLDQLSRDRLNIEGKRSRSLEELGSPQRERRAIDRARSRGPLDDPGERVYSTRSLRERQSMPDSRREYHLESDRRDLREEYIDERGDEDYRVYRTR